MSIWFTARGAGLSALILLSLSTCLGALVSRHTGTAHAARRYVVQYLHRAFAGLGVLVLALHIGTILADSYANVGLTGALIPFTSGYRPTPVALGSLAAYTFLAVSLLGLARGRMAGTERGVRIWRGLHSLAYLGWAMAMVHGFLTGTDSSVGWVRGIYVASLVAVLGAIGLRVVDRYRAIPGEIDRVLAAGPGSTGSADPVADRFAGRPAPSRPAQPPVRPVRVEASR